MPIIETGNLKARVVELTRADNVNVFKAMANIDVSDDRSALEIFGDVDNLITARAVKALWIRQGDDWQPVAAGTAVDIDHNGDSVRIAFPLTPDALAGMPASLAVPLVNAAVEVNEFVRSFIYQQEAPADAGE